MEKVIDFSSSKGPYADWTYEHITNPTRMLQAFGRDKPKSIGFDTESSGLHIKKDMPFLIQIGWGRKVFTFEPTEYLMTNFFLICQRVKYSFAHNLK